MLKRKISLALVISMLLTLMIPTLAFGVDYTGHWSEDTIQEWFDNNKLKGYEDGSFRPDGQITRAEFMTMVNNAYDYTEKADISFTDVESDDWYYAEVQKAVKAGYLLGYEDNTARPGNKISRQEAALIIARIKELSNYASGANVFADVNEIALWAKGGVGAVASEKLMIGYEDNTFRPLRFISRAEALVTIDRAYEEAAPVETSPSTGGGSTGGNDSGESYTYAILSGVEFNDGTTSSAITGSAITTNLPFTTTSSAITITAITTTSSAIEVVVTTSGTAITTSSSITANGRFVINADLITGDNVIKITVTDPVKDKPRTYTITVKKQ